MKKMLLMLAICLCMIPADVYAADLGRQMLGTNDGWGAASGGTTGGAKASSSNVYTVSNRQQLVSALGEAPTAHRRLFTYKAQSI